MILSMLRRVRISMLTQPEKVFVSQHFYLHVCQYFGLVIRVTADGEL
jgi:hypothetical protein